MIKRHKTDVPSLISRDGSTAIKGLLILLVVLGHAGVLAIDPTTGDRMFLGRWLYSFHVYLFFILPFIYGYPPKIYHPRVDGGRCEKMKQVVCDLRSNLLKIGVPYCLFFFFSAMVFVAVGGYFDLVGVFYAFFFGNEPLMDKYVGFNFLWFLPSMLALITLKSIYYNSDYKVRFGIMVVSIVLWVLAVFKQVDRYELGMLVPFSISQAFYFIIWGVTTRYIIEKYWSTRFFIPTVVVLIGVMTGLLFCSKEIHTVVSIAKIVYLFMPILMFLLLYGFQGVLSKSKILKFFGTYSLQVYLVHVYVINALSVFFNHYLGQKNGLGVVIYLLSLGISGCLALLMMKVPIINRVLFPPNMENESNIKR